MGLSQDTSCKPLVSVVVVSYNSSKTIIETLESILNQSYHPIELIITDDCSKDNTARLCKDWLDANKNRFEEAYFISDVTNKGTTCNIDKGVKAAKGHWVKTIAGDDLLNPNAIEELVKFAESNNCKICCCDLEFFSTEGQIPKVLINQYEHYFSCVEESWREQRKRIASEYFIPGPGLFFLRQLYEELGGYNLKYPMYEEYDFAYRTLCLGYKIYALPQKLVKYRFSVNSLSAGRKGIVGNVQLFMDRKNVFYDIQKQELIKQGKLLKVWSIILYYKRGDIELKYGKDSKVAHCSIILKWLDPLAYYEKIKRVIS